MAPSNGNEAGGEHEKSLGQEATEAAAAPSRSSRWGALFRRAPGAPKDEARKTSPSSIDGEDEKGPTEKWSLGILNDPETDEVPGSVLLMSKQFKRNEPLGLRHAPSRTSASSLPSPYLTPEERAQGGHTPARSPGLVVPPESAYVGRSRSPRPQMLRMFSGISQRSVQEKKRTADGKIILEPQPEESLNDPLNWPSWRRDVALLSLGFYCAIGGGMTPVLAAGFNNVAATYGVSEPTVSLTTGFYMLGLGCGSVVASPTAILFGKRPVYIAGALLFIVSSIWCAYSPNYASLVVARIVMGFSISPVECLPSATIAEIFYLHERAYRLGIYTLLLLGGKNLIPLISAAIIDGLDWQWVFKIIAIAAGACVILLFFYVPETFWDRAPRPKQHVRKHHLGSLSHLFSHHHHGHASKPQHSAKSLHEGALASKPPISLGDIGSSGTIAQRRLHTSHHVGFANETREPAAPTAAAIGHPEDKAEGKNEPKEVEPTTQPRIEVEETDGKSAEATATEADAEKAVPEKPKISRAKTEDHQLPYFMSRSGNANTVDLESGNPAAVLGEHFHGITTPRGPGSGASTPTGSSLHHTYTQHLRVSPPKTYKDTLKPWNGRLRRDNWFKVAFRPFILYAYPAILWSTLVYSLSIGWLIVLSESVSIIYRNANTYNFNALQAGLVYISPFIGGILGTAVAGKLSDIIVRSMARRNNGIYEPEFRLVMALPILLATSIGLMGFGWSEQERDNFMVPTVFFGIISFGCSLGSTTSITFAVDSYRQYAGEALVTLNFSKNVFHGFVFSLFFTNWLVQDGGRKVFLTIGGIQVICMLSAIPMYIYGKRARMWTVRKNMMERF